MIETTARNAAANPDAAGICPPADDLLANQPACRQTALPAGRIVGRLTRLGLPAMVSHDAGAYLCNAVYFHSLRLDALLGGRGQCGFAHLPASMATQSTPLSLGDAVAGGLEIIATMLRHPPIDRPRNLMVA